MSRIQASVELLAETLQKKNNDYAGENGEFFNFSRSAELASVSTLAAMLVQIGVKVTRIQNLFDRPGASNEPLVDSLLDLAGYAVIAHAYVNQDLTTKSDWNPAG